MTQTREKATQKDEDQQTRFYLIFDELAKANLESASDASLEEIDEIEQIRRMVVEVDEEPPIFMTST
ncbi:MAG: hypothetical protein WBQ43_10070 [Terriglobales bacterium]